jgi:DNA (cytosine-5)-methyltransferase 1
VTSVREIERIADHMPPAYDWVAHRPNGLRFHDFFCGAGGSSLGMTGAGFELAMGLNHWKLAIETHAYNFRDAAHECQDITAYDLRKMPKAEVLWASPICTEASPAGGTAKWEPDLFNQDHVDKPGMERTRATFYEVLRATELWRYEAILVENVADVATRWILFDHWVEGMKLLGYNVQYVSVSAAHIGSEDNPHAPQWRDRLYMVFTKVGAPLPDVEPRPLAYCFGCQTDVNAVQSWKKPGRKIGKYRQQYTYVCPNSECRHRTVEPYVLPAGSIIDWSNPGIQIGKKVSRRKDGLPLAPKTLARIQAGLEMFAQPVTAEVAGNTYERPGSGYIRAWPANQAPLTAQTTTPTKALAQVPPVMVTVNHGGDDARAIPAQRAPLPTRTIKVGEGLAQAEPFTVPAGGTWRDGPASLSEPMGARTTRETDALVCPPLLTEHRRNGEARPVNDEPSSTITAGGNHHSITMPPEGAFYVKNYGGNARPQDMARSVNDPFGAITTKDHTSLVIPFRRGSKPHLPSEPVGTMATHAQHGLAKLGIDLYDCFFRMLTADEHLLAQRFHPSYRVLGNGSERTMQAGNAVAANVAQWLAAATAAALCGDQRAA